MWFYKAVSEPATMLAGVPSEKKFELRIEAFMFALVFMLILVGMSIYAYKIGWSEGANKILSIIKYFLGGAFVGAFLGERNAIKK